MLRGVIFDMDGVIVDSHPAHRRAWRMFFQTLGRTLSDNDLDFVLDGRKRSEILRHFLGDLSDEEVLELGNRKDELLKKAALQVDPLPGVIELIDRLRDARIATAVATSASSSRARSTLNRLGLMAKFDGLVTGNDVVLGKPDPSIYQRACQLLDLTPAEAIAIEDAESGVLAASSAGILCIGLSGHRSPENLRAAGAVLVVDTFIGLSLARLELLLAESERDSDRRPCFTRTR